jgi:hypothetical protein
MSQQRSRTLTVCLAQSILTPDACHCPHNPLTLEAASALGVVLRAAG